MKTSIVSLVDISSKLQSSSLTRHVSWIRKTCHLDLVCNLKLCKFSAGNRKEWHDKNVTTHADVQLHFSVHTNRM